MSEPMTDADLVYERWSRNDLLAEVRRLREEQAVMIDVIRAADALARRADRTDPLWAMPQIMADLEAALDRFDDLPGDAA